MHQLLHFLNANCEKKFSSKNDVLAVFSFLGTKNLYFGKANVVKIMLETILQKVSAQ